jgi:hypothetical protein
VSGGAAGLPESSRPGLLSERGCCAAVQATPKARLIDFIIQWVSGWIGADPGVFVKGQYFLFFAKWDTRYGAAMAR